MKQWNILHLNVFSIDCHKSTIVNHFLIKEALSLDFIKLRDLCYYFFLWCYLLYSFSVCIFLYIYSCSISFSFFLSHILPSPILVCLSLFFLSLIRYTLILSLLLAIFVLFSLSLSPSISLIFNLPDSVSFYSDWPRKVKWYVWVTIRISKIKPILSSLLKWKTAIPL